MTPELKQAIEDAARIHANSMAVEYDMSPASVSSDRLHRSFKAGAEWMHKNVIKEFHWGNLTILGLTLTQVEDLKNFHLIWTGRAAINENDLIIKLSAEIKELKGRLDQSELVCLERVEYYIKTVAANKEISDLNAMCEKLASALRGIKNGSIWTGLVGMEMLKCPNCPSAEIANEALIEFEAFNKDLKCEPKAKESHMGWFNESD